MLINVVTTYTLPDQSEIKRLSDAPDELNLSADFFGLFGLWQ
jgi:hypothetical protein